MPADEPPVNVAAWILPLLDGSRAQRAEWAVSNAGLEGRIPEQVAALRAALAAVRRPLARTRVIRLIADLELADLVPDLRPGLSALAAEERAGTVRALGRLRDVASEAALRALLADPVHDVRDAARIALANITTPPTTPAPSAVTRTNKDGAARWTVNEASNTPPEESGWQAQLRARFSASQAATGDTGAGDTGAATTPPPSDRPTES
jgi:HEAT repeat protein